MMQDTTMKLLKTLFIIIFLQAALFAQADLKINEDEMFNNSETVVDTKNKFENNNLDDDQNKKRIGVSGEIKSINQYVKSKTPEIAGLPKTTKLSPYMLGSLLTDFRLPSNIKGFGNFEALHNASTNKSVFSMKELFVDFNIERAVYFRAGKQVLQWGRCYLWNPTDLINIEKQHFITSIGGREGTSGLKMHVPFGTVLNIYGFASTYKAERADQIAGAGKIEFLIGKTEMAFSGWKKKGYHPVYGYDFSTRLFEIDIVGEASLSHGSNTYRVESNGTVITTGRESGKWISKASIDFGHGFDFNNQPKKIQVNAEFFYNGDGYKDNIFDDKTLWGTKAGYFLSNNMYEPNYYSEFYAALFLTINKFIISDFSLKFNTISNIKQKSFIQSVGISYLNINNFKAGLEVYAFLGDKNSEYTFSGAKVQVLLSAGIIF